MKPILAWITVAGLVAGCANATQSGTPEATRVPRSEREEPSSDENHNAKKENPPRSTSTSKTSEALPPELLNSLTPDQIEAIDRKSFSDLQTMSSTDLMSFLKDNKGSGSDMGQAGEVDILSNLATLFDKALKPNSSGSPGTTPKGLEKTRGSKDEESDDSENDEEEDEPCGC